MLEQDVDTAENVSEGKEATVPRPAATDATSADELPVFRGVLRYVPNVSSRTQSEKKTESDMDAKMDIRGVWHPLSRLSSATSAPTRPSTKLGTAGIMPQDAASINLNLHRDVTSSYQAQMKIVATSHLAWSPQVAWILCSFIHQNCHFRT